MTSEPIWGDPITEPYWRAALEHRLVVQHCATCGHYQFYPRPFCLSCGSDAVSWKDVTGRGTVYSKTRIWLQVLADLEPPYVLAIVELEEGPRLTTRLVGDDVPIGGTVELAWLERPGKPPLPAFRSRPTVIADGEGVQSGLT